MSKRAVVVRVVEDGIAKCQRAGRGRGNHAKVEAQVGVRVRVAIVVRLGAVGQGDRPAQYDATAAEGPAVTPSLSLLTLPSGFDAAVVLAVKPTRTPLPVKLLAARRTRYVSGVEAGERVHAGRAGRGGREDRRACLVQKLDDDAGDAGFARVERAIVVGVAEDGVAKSQRASGHWGNHAEVERQVGVVVRVAVVGRLGGVGQGDRPAQDDAARASQVPVVTPLLSLLTLLSGVGTLCVLAVNPTSRPRR